MTDVQKNKRAPNPREEAMEAIGRSRNEEFTRETGIEIVASEVIVDPDPDANADDAVAEAERKRLEALAASSNDDDDQMALQREQEAEAARKREEEDAAAQAAIQNAQSKAGIKHKLKVNGAEIEMTEEEMIRQVQKGLSADQRLEEATRLKREAEEMQRSIQQQQEAKTTAKTGDESQIDPATAKEFTSALFSGDEEKATLAFQKAVSGAVSAAKIEAKGRGDATPVDPNAIAAQVRQQIAIESALESSKRDYPEMWADPDYDSLAGARIKRLVGEGKPFVTALEEVQTGMAEKFGWKKPTGTPRLAANTDRREEKLKRKESLEQSPSGPNVKSSTQEAPVASVHDTIREMAQKRGQQLV